MVPEVIGMPTTGQPDNCREKDIALELFQRHRQVMATFLDTPDRKAVQRHIEERGWTLNRLSNEAGVSYSTLHTWLSGKQSTLRVATAKKLAAALSVSVDTLLSGEKYTAPIRCVGRVGAGEVVEMFDGSDAYDVPTPPGLKAGRPYECLQIVGRSMFPAQPGWLVYYETEPRSPEDLIGQACVVQLEDGRMLFKVLRHHGDSRELYSLHSWSPGEPPIEGVRIVKAQSFAALTPRP